MISITERLGSGCGSWLDLSGPLWTSSHGRLSHSHTAPFTQRGRPTPPTASGDPNPKRQASRAGLGLHQTEDYEQRGGPGQPPRPPRDSRSPRRCLQPSGGRAPGLRVLLMGQLVPGAGRQQCTASRVPLAHCGLSSAHRNKEAEAPVGSH